MKLSRGNVKKMPILFLAHGSPMNIISDNDFTRSLGELGRRLPRPKSILVISAHWLTNGTKVLCTEKPKTIYDFYGFPDELYRIRYASLGDPPLAEELSERLKSYKVECDKTWGYDHASWSIMHHIYPKADIPMIELSLDYGFNRWNLKSMENHYQFAKNLSYLREREVLIIGSGNIVHNLGKIDFEVDAPIMRWAGELDELVKKHLVERNHSNLINFHEMGAVADIGIPTWDHYLPMIYIIALQSETDSIQFIHEGFQHGSISMRSFQIG